MWTAAASWSLGHVPLPAEDVVINTNITMNAGSVTVNSLTVNSPRTLTIGNSTTAQTLNVTTYVTVNSGGTIAVGNFNAVHSLTVGGTLTNAGTLTLWNSASQVCNLILNGTSLTGNGTYTLNSITVGGAVTNNSTSNITVKGDITSNNTFQSTAGTFTFNAATTQNLNGTTNPTFNNISIATNNTIVLLSGISGITVNGTFTMANNTTFDFGSGSARTVTIVGNLVTPQTITMTGAGLAHQWILGGATNAAPGTFNTTANSGSTVEYNNASTQTVFASNNYRHVKLSGSGTKTFSNTTTINNDLNITGANVVVSNANTLTVSGNLNNNGTGTTVWGGNANTLTLTGNLLVTNNTTFTIGNAAQVKTLNVTGNVQVDLGSTLNVGAFAAVHLLSISGNLQVDGTFNMVQTFPGNVCNVTFSGATNNTVTSPGGTGTIGFNQITLTKGAVGNVLDVQAPITMSSPTAAGAFLTLTSGTFKLSSASTLTPYYGAATISAGAGGLWLNNSGANVSCVQTATTTAPGNPTVTGLLRITAGTFAYGSGNDVMAVNAATSNLWIDGGTLNMYGGVSFSSTSQFNMTSGNFRIDPQAVDNYPSGTVMIGFSSTSATNAVTFTGGTLTIVDPPASGNGTTLFITPTAGYAYNFSGSTISFGDGVSNNTGSAGFGFTVDAGSRYPLSNVVLNNGTSTGSNRFVRLTNTDCTINSSLVFGNNANDSFQLNGRQLTLNGTLTPASGTLVGSATSTLVIGGSNTPVMSLPPIVGGNLLSLTINKTGTNNTVNLGSSVTLAATGILTLTSGVLEIGNYNLTLTNNAAIAGTPFSATNMVATDGSGYLIRNVASTQTLSPIGAAGYYTPMTLSSITAGGTYSIRAVPTALNPGYISVYWDFVTSTPGKTITATFQYDPAQLNGATQIISYAPAPYTVFQRPPLSGTSSFGTNSFTITGNTTATAGGYWTMGNTSTFYSYQTGDWNTPSTWTSDPSGTLQSGTTVPGYNDNVVILTGRTVSMTSNITAQLLNLQIDGGGFVDMSTFSFTSGLSTLSGQGTVRLASINFPTIAANTFINAGGGTVEYYNAASFALPVAQTTYNNLTINCAGRTATQLMNLTLNGNLLVKAGTFQINDNTSTRRQLTINGDVTVNSGAAITVGTGVTNTTTNPTTITTAVAGPFIEYYDNQSHRVVINGNFTNNGTVSFSNIPYPVYNAFPPTSTGATSGFATVYFQGSTSNVLTCNNTTTFYNLVLDKGNDQTYSLTVNSSAYGYFKLYGANNAVADASAGATATNPNIKKALWIRNGTLILQGSTIIPSLTEGNTTGTLPATSDYFIPANGGLYINGPDVVVLGTADDYREVNTAYSVSGGTGLANGVLQGGYSALYVYGKLQISDGYLSMRESGGIVTNGGSGQIVINGGDVDAKQFLNATSSTASFQMSGGFFALRGRMKRVPLSYATVANLVDTVATTINTVRATNGTTTGFGTFNINNAANIFNMSSGDIWIYDVCDATPPATAPYVFDVKSSASNISVTGGTLTIIPTAGTGAADETNHVISSNAALGNLVIKRPSSSTVVQLAAGYPLTVLSKVNIQSGSFDANAQNLTIGGNFTIANGATYVATGTSANTTILNGSGAQTITVNTASALALNNLTLTKTSGVAVNFAGSQTAINVGGILNLTLGTLNDNGNTISVAGNVYNSGVHAGTGKISLNGSTSTQTIDGNGIFQNLELNSTNAATAPISLANNVTINGVLTFSRDNLFNISTYNLKFNASATVANAGTLRYAQSAGTAGDGGITKVYTSPTAFVFPIGAASTSHVGVPKYTPASIGLSAAPTAYGSITVVPVGYAHPNETTTGRALTYFWRVKSSGFTLGTAKVTHGYTYSVNDVVTGTNITENGYVAARYDVNTTSWTKGTTSDLDITNKIIGQPTAGTFLKNVSFIDGDYTAGDDTPTDPFGTPKVFYSYATGAWGTAASWTSDPTRATFVNIGTPGATDVVHIGAGHTISFGTPTNYLTNPNTDPHSCATLYIDAGSVLDVRYNPSSNLGIVMNSSLGNGRIKITCAQASGSTFANPAGDFSSFNTNLGTTELYSTNPGYGTTYWMANGVTTYGNLLFSPLGGSNIIFPNNDVLIYGNCTETGGNADSWLCPTWSGNYPLAPAVTVAKTITINGNLDIQGGAFGWYGNGNVAQNVVVKGNVTVCSVCALDNFGGGATNQTLTIGGTLTNDGNGLANGGAGQIARVALSTVPVTFNGNNSASITNTVGTPTTILGSVTVNKGSSQATTLNLNIAGTLTTPADNWLTLQNGTLQYQRPNPNTDFTISAATNLNIPSTAGLYINYTNSNNKNVLIASNGADASDLLLSGKLTVVNGNVYVGQVGTSAFNNDIEYSGNSAAIQVTGGTLTVNGQIRRSTASTNGALSYTQSNGTVTINGNSSAGGLATSLTRAKLEVLNTGSQFNMSAGTLTLQRGGGTTFGDLYIRPSSSTVTGGTIIFSNTVPNAVQNYTMDATASLNNLSVTAGGSNGTNATVTLMTNPLVLKGTLTLSNNKSFFNANNRNVTINQDLVNNGSTASYVYGTNLTTFTGSTQNISGTSATNFYDLTVSPSVTLTVNNSFTVNHDLTIGSGSLLLNANKVTVLTDGAFVNNGAFSDDNITGGISMAGSSLQEVSGTGSFNRLEINNANNVALLNDITLDHNLVMTNGIFNIKSNNLILNTTANISGSSFSSTKMIMTDGVATSLGLTKFFPVISSTTTFTYPLGVASKYTPAVFTINASGAIGYIKVAPVDSYQPTVIDPSRVLDYYFSISSSGIVGFDGTLVLNYLASDVNGTESDYVAGWLQLPGTYWSKAAVGPATDNVNETTHKITFPFPAGSSNLNGDYTAGEDPAIPSQIPTYISNSDGNWSDNTIWTPVGASPPCPVGGPNGYNVIIQNNVSTTVNNCFAYTTVIQGTGKLSILSPTYGHNFGTVDGDASLGTGTLYLESANLPAGNFTPFLDCLGTGTIEYGGTGSYTLILNGFTSIPNLTFSGTGTRILPNTDLTICNTLKIDGPTLDNSVNNRSLTVNGSMERYNAGAFLSGSGSTATVTFSGSAAQTLGGATGDFTGANAFNNLEIDNSAGLSIGANGNIEVNGNLSLTNGIVTTTSTNSLSILNTSSSAIVPTGGSATSYINGPLKKQIVNGGAFVYPLGQGSVKGHTFTLTSASTGTSLFTAQYFTPNPTASSVTAPIIKMNRLEYWTVTATASKTARVGIAWDAQSDLNGYMTVNGISDLEVTEYNTGTSSWVGLTSTTTGVNNLGSATTTSNVNLSTTPKNYSLGSITDPTPLAVLSPTGAVCGTAGIPVTITTHSPITLNYTISYSFNGVAQTPIVVTSLPFTLPTSAAGSYQLTGFKYNNSTVTGNVDGTAVTTDASPTTSVAGSNQSLCNATSLNLSGNNPTVGTGLWTITSGTGGWFNTPNATNYNALFGGPPGHTYTLKWTITNGSCTSSSSVSISFPYAPQQPSAFTTASTSVCKGTSGYVYTVPAVAGATSYQWSYSGAGATIVGSSNSVTINFSAAATNGTLSVSAVNGCGPGTARTIGITTTTPAVATFNYAASPYCPNASNPSPTFTGGGVAGTFSSTTGLVFVSTSTGQVNLSASTPGTYTVTNTIAPAGPCGTITATSSITITATGNWLGGISSNWLDPNNWICTTVPTSSTDVVIPAGAANMPIINAAGAICKSITINSGASLTINGTNNLDVYGNWTNGGTFTRNSSMVTFKGTSSIGGAAVTTFNDVTISATGNITAPAGNVNVAGNWVNNGTFTASTGTITFTGTTPSTISGTTTFYNLTMSKTGNNATLNGTATTTVNNVLTLTTGNLVSSATHGLALTATATTSGSSANSFVSGPMTKVLTGTSFVFPLGSASANRYRPAMVNNTSGPDTWSAEYVGANPTSGGYSNNIYNYSFLKKVSEFEYWLISRAGATSADLTLSYNVGSYIPPNIGNVANLKVVHWDGAMWDIPTGGGTFSQSGTNITGTVSMTQINSFSPFTLGSGDITSPLPIKLLYFKASVVDDAVLTEWATAEEENNDFFTIEKSSDGETFTEVVKVPSQGDTKTGHKYSFSDPDPYPGLSYYRLKQTDFDRKFTYSKVVAVRYDGVTSVSMKAYPNPFAGKKITVELKGFQGVTDIPVQIFDMLGQPVMERILTTSKSGIVREDLVFDNTLPAGLYILKAGPSLKLTQKIEVE
ncbi:hypothetical protein D4L85_19750 [Chryseolinea soli]|uniref:PKD-like domain-containing protein n=1 Tax=Chryseolinea soli TaxID=2321403 RepID=A0A385SP99_9BACT|nr:hypothetical protein D4L85_19750 [Chryseolinea soli]